MNVIKKLDNIRQLLQVRYVAVVTVLAVLAGVLGIIVITYLTNKSSQLVTTKAIVVVSPMVIGTTNFEIGYDYTQNSHLTAGAGGNAISVASAKHLLTSLDAFQNTPIMGWGLSDPEPLPGIYDWTSLDQHVEVMGETVPESQRMITLCTAPGWMKVSGKDWDMSSAVSPTHFQDFAKLAAQVALRYDGTHRAADGTLLPKVDYFDVWNELKGFWNTQEHGWDMQSYMAMYNDVYMAIKTVRPDAQIGGPYAPMKASPTGTSLKGVYGGIENTSLAAVQYWLQHKVGAQFISIDGGPDINAKTGQRGVNSFDAGSYFANVVHWIRGLNATSYPGSKSLPVFWAEFYPAVGYSTGQKAVAKDVSNIIQAGQAGVSKMLIWEMEGDPGGYSPYTGVSVFTDTVTTQGGQPTVFYDALQSLHNTFPSGTVLYKTSVTGPITALASKADVLLVSQSSKSMAVMVNGRIVNMQPYGLTIVPVHL